MYVVSIVGVVYSVVQYLELSLHAVHDDLQVQLPHALDGGLARLLVAVVPEGGVEGGLKRGVVKGRLKGLEVGRWG
jgi:hypothetical protein